MNTFQAVLTANRRESYVIFNYGDIAWTTGKASEGDDNGLGGYPAEVGKMLNYPVKTHDCSHLGDCN